MSLPTQQTGHLSHPAPVYVLPNMSPGLGRSYRFLRFMFVVLGLIVVLNLNVFSNRLLGNGQFFSPIILLFSLLAVLYSRVGRISQLPFATRMFGFAIVFFVFAGVLSKVANGLGSPVTLAIAVAKDLATPIVFFGTVFLSASMKKLGGEKGEGQVLTIVYWLAFAGVMTIFIPLVFPQWHYFIRGDERNFSRFGGVYDNPNPASMAALAFMVCGLARTAREKKLIYLMITIGAGAAAILLTGSRAGILGTVFIVLPLAGFVFSFKQIIRVVLTFVVVAAVGLTILFTLRQQTDSRLRGQAKRAQLLLSIADRGLDDETTGGRTGLAVIAFKMWKTSPLIGLGLGSSRGMLPYTDLGPHNYYLTILVESGLFGLIPFLFLWSCVGAKSFDRNNPNWIRILIIGIFLTISFYALTSHTIFNQRNQVFFIGAAMGLSVLPRRRK